MKTCAERVALAAKRSAPRLGYGGPLRAPSGPPRREPVVLIITVSLRPRNDPDTGAVAPRYGRLNVFVMNTAIWPRVLLAVGQELPPPQPPVIPSAASASM